MPLTDFFRALVALVKPNRRRYDRRPVALPVRLHVGPETVDCRIIDVSASGALLAGAPTSPIGTLVVLEVPPMLVSADARIVRHSPQGIGIEFSKDGVGAIIAGWVRGQSPSGLA